MAASPSDKVPLVALRVAGQVMRERVRRPKAVRRADVPGSVHAITPAWLTEVLAGDAPGAVVETVTVRHVSSGTHERDRLLVSYNDAGWAAGLPPSIFTKSTPSIVTRVMCGYNGTARVEGQFYTHVRPLLDLEAPRAYHAAWNRATLTAMLLLEDLVATKGATFTTFRTEVTRAMAEDMVDLLAALHGRFYDDPELDRRFPWLASYPAWFRIGAAKMQVERYTARSLDRAAERLPADVRARRDEVWPAVLRAVEVHERQPRSVLHSDVHIGNWYRTDTGRMGLCDWQCPSKGHWSRDVAYALAAGLTPEHRRAWERELLDRYLERLGEATGARIEREDAWRWYRQQMFHALWMWTITLCHSPLLPGMQPEETSLAMIERITTALSDLDCFDSF
jgi:thiamine kinase-like enzyme